MLPGPVLDTGDIVVVRELPVPAPVELKFKWIGVMYMFLLF